jgi:guanylate kinase
VTAPLVVVSGPSGVGKSTVVAAALAQDPSIWLSVSATTRQPRPGEVDGREYFFTPDADFDALVAAGGLLEWAAYAGNRYGTPRGPVDERRAAGVPVLLEIEVQGARQVRAAVPDALLVFLAPPSWEVLEARLTGRGTEDPDAVARRLGAAREELSASGEFDVVLVNADVQECARALVAWATDPANAPQGRVHDIQ